jgi:hypothetical protein
MTLTDTLTRAAENKNFRGRKLFYRMRLALKSMPCKMCRAISRVRETTKRAMLSRLNLAGTGHYYYDYPNS